MSGIVVILLITAALAGVWFILASSLDALIGALTWTCGDCGRRYSWRTRSCPNIVGDLEAMGRRP